MKYKRVNRDALRPITSEVSPYEVPLPFDTVPLYTFLKKIKFTWVSDTEVKTLPLTKAEECVLEIIFDGIKFNKGREEDGYVLFNLSGRSKGSVDLKHPYKYRVRRNNGKFRHLALPHPQSMMTMSHFLHEYRDSILYFTNRSAFSIRYPLRVARLHAQRDTEFARAQDRDSHGVEQSNLEYEYLTSYFSYARYNNINRFYSSAEFRACERKYPRLLRLDVSKCFDSIYTHTVSWVTNGIDASKKQKEKTKGTFGGKFDHIMQYLNYAETSGIIIGPEFSRVFAEIIMQEVDVRVERELVNKGKVFGKDYEIMRYVDDYFVFLADVKDSALVEGVLAEHLANFKLHLNDHKQHEFDTPLESRMSIAKLRLRESLKARTKCEVDLEGVTPSARLYLSAHEVILDYKATLIDFDLGHDEVANSYLYALHRRASKVMRKYGKYLDEIKESCDTKKLASAQIQLVKYFVANIEVALFVYAGAPSVSHSLKIARLVVSLLKELHESGAGMLQMQSFRDKIVRELEAQLSAVRDESSFGVHTLLLVDCLIFIDPEIPEKKLYGILSRRNIDISSLDAFGVLTFLRRFAFGGRGKSEMKRELLVRVRELVDLGVTDQRHNAERVMLRLCIPFMPGLTVQEIYDAVNLSKGKVQHLLGSRCNPSLFAWNANDNYYERLQMKASQVVY